MSGEHCNRDGILRNSQDLVGSPAPSTLRSVENIGASGTRKSCGSAAEKGGDTVLPKKGKLSTHELLDSAEFNKTIATWFGEKGFIAMRSFFRASVLNSLQKDPIGLNQSSCTDLDAVIVTLIADYLVKNKKYFTMSVLSNEVLRPLVKSNPKLKQVLQMTGKCEELDEPTLSRETVSFVLRTLDVQTHSTVGAGILHRCLEDRSGDLLSVLMGLLRDNAPTLNFKERAVRDDDVVAALTDGLQEEMGKLHCWFSNFNSQFVDVSGKVRKLICSQTNGDGVKHKNVRGGQDERELWNQMVRMDEHLKKQQECIMKMRDNERKKLATYAKELENLHQEMNQKLKSIQDYEKTLKIREKAVRESEAMGVALLEHRGRGDHKTVEMTPRDCLGGIYAGKATQRFNEQMLHAAGRVGEEMIAQIMQENLELRAILREQDLRIEALTKKSALMSSGCHGEESTAPRGTATSNWVCHSSDNLVTSRQAAFRMLPQSAPSCKPGESLVSAMSSALRRARMEIDSLRDEQNVTDLQYNRILHNKLSKSL